MGDTAPELERTALARHVPQEATSAAQGKQLATVLGLLDNDTLTTSQRAAAARHAGGASDDDLGVLREALLNEPVPVKGHRTTSSRPTGATAAIPTST